MTASSEHQPEPLYPKGAIPGALGWVAMLTARHVREFAAEISQFTQAAGTEQQLSELLDRWRKVAEQDRSNEVAEHLERTRRGRLSTPDEFAGGRGDRI
ncbi:MAG: hypothetical protein ACRDG3_05840 [Tepidiformaceae bacterium]